MHPLNPSYDHNLHRTAESQKENITYTIKTLNPVFFLNFPKKTQHWKQFFIRLSGILWRQSTSHTYRAEVFLGGGGGGAVLKGPYYTYSGEIIPSRTLFRVFGMHAKDPISFLITKELAGLKERLFIPLCFQWRSWSPHWIIYRDEYTGDLVVSCLEVGGPHHQILPLFSPWHRAGIEQMPDNYLMTEWRVGFRSVWRQWKKSNAQKSGRG